MKNRGAAGKTGNTPRKTNYYNNYPIISRPALQMAGASPAAYRNRLKRSRLSFRKHKLSFAKLEIIFFLQRVTGLFIEKHKKTALTDGQSCPEIFQRKITLP